MYTEIDYMENQFCREFVTCFCQITLYHSQLLCWVMLQKILKALLVGREELMLAFLRNICKNSIFWGLSYQKIVCFISQDQASLVIYRIDYYYWRLDQMSQIVLIYVSQYQGEKVSLLMTFDSSHSHFPYWR